jgi:hypothetical protein
MATGSARLRLWHDDVFGMAVRSLRPWVRHGYVFGTTTGSTCLLFGVTTGSACLLFGRGEQVSSFTYRAQLYVCEYVLAWPFVCF